MDEKEKKRPASSQASELRRQAEQRLRIKATKPTGSMADGDIHALVHELQVHQIELEMQNEELRRVEAAAQELSDKYCNLFDFAPTGYFLLDESGQILEVNLAGAALLAQDRSAVVKKRFAQFVAVDDRTEFAEYRRRMLQANARQSGEFTLLINSERMIHALVEGIAVRDEEGKATGCRIAVTDVTERKQAEKVAMENAEVYRTLVERADVGITLIDPDLNIVMANTKQAKAVGRSPDELVGKKCFCEYGGLDAVCPDCQGLKAMASGIPAVSERTGTLKDGRTFAVRLNASPLFDQEGKPRGFIEIVEDVSERKREQDALRLANFCVQHAGDGIFWIDPEARIVFANQKASEVLEYSCEELQAMTVFDFDAVFPQERWGSHWEAIRQEKSFVFESWHRTKTGRIFPVEISVNYMAFDGKEYNCAIARDISKRKEDEKQLAHFSAVVNSSQDAIIGKTLDGIVSSWNLGAEHLFGYTAAEMIGQSISKLQPPGRSEEFMTLLSRVKDGGCVEHFDTVRRRKDESLVDVSLTLSPIKNSNGEIVGASTITRDITDRKRTGELLRASEERLTGIIQNAAETIYTLSLDGVITFVSPTWTRVLGHDISEVQGQPFVPFIHPEDVAICQTAIERVLATGETQHGMYRIRHKDGNWRWHHSVGSLIKDPQGRPVGLVGVAEDVTDAQACRGAAGPHAETTGKRQPAPGEIAPARNAGGEVQADCRHSGSASRP